MAEAYIIDAVRTPRGIGKQGKGALAHMHPQHLAATCLKAIKERNDLDTATVDDVIWSVSTQDGMQAGDLGRMAALDAGYDITAPIPSCVLMFKQELPLMYAEDPDVQAVKARIFDPFEYLMLRHKAGLLLVVLRHFG